MTVPAAPAGHVAVAFSGGRDSTALLHATCSMARQAGLVVHSLHVHHGLSTQADAWLAHCRAQCRRWARNGAPLHFHFERLHIPRGGATGIEAAARAARYVALQRMAIDAQCDLVLLAHHREDQAETVLLQALRGAGSRGLAAMPSMATRNGITWARPWLGQPREAIESYVARHRLAYVDDDSNTDVRYARNRLRHEVWPALVHAFPQAAAALAQVATQAQDATALLDDIAQADLANVADDGGLDLARWAALPPARARNVLQAWLRGQGIAVTRDWVMRLSRELPGRQLGRWLLPEGVLRAYRGRVRWQAHPESSPAAATAEPQPATPVLLCVTAPGRHHVPRWGGALEVELVEGGAGVPLAALASLCLRARAGGDRFQRAPGATPRSLKKEFQWAGLPAWAREGPVVADAQGRVVYVPGLGMDARFAALPGEPRVSLAWRPAAG